eukprot:gnl/TRDRNA2_/TRDRNA2_163080_c1_seq1.p1 gnl/TRDRNA2_/TRDRNA2_163080_c1~~gnl/TRDRNA2_/TRDRNA2_163080_c1_seq1.p1  ORF type:complete len:239 (+),score=9.85 gnl/TRDRNA2_/TRDRNA2_163080_c1_seq1:4-720(+)
MVLLTTADGAINNEGNSTRHASEETLVRSSELAALDACHVAFPLSEAQSVEASLLSGLEPEDDTPSQTWFPTEPNVSSPSIPPPMQELKPGILSQHSEGPASESDQDYWDTAAQLSASSGEDRFDDEKHMPSSVVSISSKGLRLGTNTLGHAFPRLGSALGQTAEDGAWVLGEPELKLARPKQLPTSRVSMSMAQPLSEHRHSRKPPCVPRLDLSLVEPYEEPHAPHPLPLAFWEVVK